MKWRGEQSKWEDGDRIDRIHWAHDQKDVSHTRQNWGRQDNKKPCFCKNFPNNTCSFSKEHETNEKLHKHICAYCLTLGKQLNHSEKNYFTKQQQLKNDSSLGWSSCAKNDTELVVSNDIHTGTERARRWTSGVAEVGNVKTSYSHYLLCETSVVKPTVSGGLQCKCELVKNSTDTDRVSHNSQCESSKVHNAGIGSSVSRS